MLMPLVMRCLSLSACCCCVIASWALTAGFGCGCGVADGAWTVGICLSLVAAKIDFSVGRVGKC
jgi:hypothetical protein